MMHTEVSKLLITKEDLDKCHSLEEQKELLRSVLEKQGLNVENDSLEEILALVQEKSNEIVVWLDPKERNESPKLN